MRLQKVKFEIKSIYKHKKVFCCTNVVMYTLNLVVINVVYKIHRASTKYKTQGASS